MHGDSFNITTDVIKKINSIKFKSIVQICVHSSLYYSIFYGEAIGDHLQSNLGIISRPGIICGLIWVLFPVRGSFAGLYRTFLRISLEGGLALGFVRLDGVWRLFQLNFTDDSNGMPETEAPR